MVEGVTMKQIVLALAVGTALGSAAFAQGYPVATRAAPMPRHLSPDEVRDYEQDQIERRQEMERDSLRMHQKAERRALGLDDED
jgi:hypothetical protein